MHVYRRKTRSGTSNSNGRRCGDDSARDPDFFTDDARYVSLTVSASSSPSSSRMTSRRRTLRTCSGASSSRFGEEAPLGASATHSSFARPAVRPTRRSARTRPTPRPTRPTSPSGRRLRRRPTPRSSRLPSAAPASSRRSRSSTPRRSKRRVCFGARVYDQVDQNGKQTERRGIGLCGPAEEGAVRRGFPVFLVRRSGSFCNSSLVSSSSGRRAGLVFQTSLFRGYGFLASRNRASLFITSTFSAGRFLSRVARVVLHLPR